MKYKGILAAAIITALFVSFLLAQLEQQTLIGRIHQHEQITVNEPVEDDATRLPIVQIDTKGKKIPGEAIMDSTMKTIGYTTDEEGNKMSEMEVSIIDQPSQINHSADQATITTKSLIRYRGNSSRLFTKKGYLLRFVDEQGDDRSENVMGMGEDSEWVLHGPYLDKTLMRNYLCFNIIGQIMPFTPDVRFCRLSVDGKDQGLYLMMESIARGEHRVNIKKNADDDHYISYIVRMDSDPQNQTALDTFSFYTYLTQDHLTRFSTIYPGRKHLSEAWKTYIEDDISKFEKALFSYDFNDPQIGYPAYIDVDSFVNYYIFMEFFGVRDFGYRSTYLYKDAKGKLTMGPAWDFNNAMDNFFTEQSSTGMQFHDLFWYRMLLKDESFVNKVISRYHKLRQSVLDEQYLYSYIDETSTFLGKEIDHNFAIWPQSFDPSQLTIWEKMVEEDRNLTSWEEAIVEMKGYIHKRGSWLDEHIDTLYQYCHDSRNKDALLK